MTAAELGFGRTPVREGPQVLRAIIHGDAEKAAALATAHVEGFETAIRGII